MNVFIRKIFVVVVVAASVAASSQLAAKDFVSLQQDMVSYSETVEAIELESGRYEFELIEPLHALGRTQLEANLFSEAEDSIGRAIQIARFSEGLYSPVQYPLLQTEIEIDLIRENWKKVNEKLEHFTWLISQQYAGKVKPRIELARWIADVHAQVYDSDSVEMKASHLIDATYLRETVVQYAQVMKMTEDPLYSELLFELAGAYRTEVEVIKKGGSTSYRLRRMFPGTEIIQEKKEAIARRYRVGLEKLEMLQEIVGDQDYYNEKNAAIVQLYIAEWQGYFGNHSSQKAALDSVVDQLLDAKIPESDIDAYLSQVGKLSWQRLNLEFQPAVHNAVVVAD